MSKKVKCTGEQCTAMILPTTAKKTGGLCMPCSTKIPGQEGKPQGDEHSWAGAAIFLGYFGYFLFGAAVVVTIIVGFITDTFDFLTLPGKFERHGIVTQARLWELETEESPGCRSKKLTRNCTYTTLYKARFLTEDEKLYQIEASTSAFPLLDTLVLRQPFLIRYLPDDPHTYEPAFGYTEKKLSKAVEAIRELPRQRKPIVQADPVTFSDDGKRGFSAVHVSFEMLNHPWLEHPDVREKVRSYGPQKQKECEAYVGSSNADTLGGVISSPHRYPTDEDEQDAFGILNLVEPGAAFTVRLLCEVKRGRYLSYVVASFKSHLSGELPVVLTATDVESIEFRLKR